jgi:hypothetical protein
VAAVLACGILLVVINLSGVSDNILRVRSQVGASVGGLLWRPFWQCGIIFVINLSGVSNSVLHVRPQVGASVGGLLWRPFWQCDSFCY